MTWMSTFEKLHRDVYSVLQKHAAHTKCDSWVWDVFPTSRSINWRRSGSVHCLQSSKQPYGHCLPICKTCKCRPCLPSTKSYRYALLAKQYIWTTMHCSPGSKSRASSYVDVKNRQRVFAVLTVDCCVDIFVLVREKGPWVNRVQPDSLSDLS